MRHRAHLQRTVDVVEKNGLTIHILHDNECLRSAMNIFVPSEIGYDQKIDTYECQIG